MNLFERYDAALDVRATQLREAAEAARACGDQRAQSIALMQASMLGDMLKTLGRVEHDRRPGILQTLIDQATQNAASSRTRDDFDNAEREVIKAQTIRWALETLRRSEADA